MSRTRACQNAAVDGRESPYLLILELNDLVIAAHDLVALVLGRLEQLRQCKPLPSHLVPDHKSAGLQNGGDRLFPPIIGIDELVIVDAIRRIPLHALNRGLTAIQR